MTLSRPPKTETAFRRVAILFAGGPAPAANAVISTAANSFLRNEIEVVGIMNGYSRLLEYREDRPLKLAATTSCSISGCCSAPATRKAS